MHKKAQAAGLIGILALLIIFYIIFLPPLEREKILAPEKFENVTNVTEARRFLLDEAPGFLSALQEKEREHTIPNVVLEEVSEAKILVEIPPFVVKRGWIGEQKKTFTFPIKRPEITKNVLLTFALARYRGMLKLTVNGVAVFEGTLEVPNPAPIPLPSDVLKEQNTVEVEAVGAGLWLLPRIYELRDIKIISDITDPARLEASHLVSITRTEKDIIDRSTLRFFAICDEKTVGTLTVLFNQQQVFKGKPDCGSLNQQELFAIDFVEGRNTVTFLLEKGKARLEQVGIKNKLKEAKPYLQYFQIEKAARKVKLKITFVDDKSSKKAEIVVNSQRYSIEQKLPFFEKDITRAIKLGNNFISLKPLTDLNIVSLQIVVE